MGLFDFLMGDKAEEVERLSGAATQAFQDVRPPMIQEMQIQLQRLVDQGDLDPVMAEAILQEQTQLYGIQEDPRLRDAQMSALTDLQGIVDAGGLDAQARARLETIKQDMGTAERGSREAILANARARGVGGSGLELANQMLSQQGSAQRGAQGGFDTAAEAERRKMEAIQGLGGLGGQIRGQDWAQASQAAEAQDAINRFNTANQNQFGLYNTGLQNYAQEQNLNDKQRIADANVGIGNQQEVHNKGLWQQDYENRLRKAEGIAGTNRQAADQAERTGSRIQDLLTGLGGATLAGIGQGFNAYSGLAGNNASLSDENEKTDIKEASIEEIMDSLTGYKYKYKNPKNGSGKQVGVMAQDLEKTSPDMVKNTSEGKMVGMDKPEGMLFAGLANLNERLRKLEGG